MTVRTDQLLCIAKATGSKIKLESQRPKSMAGQRLWYCHWKKHHVLFYQFYEKGTTRAMVGLQGLHRSDTSQHSNVSASVGLKSFFPWCFKLGGNTETIATHLRSPLSVDHCLQHLQIIWQHIGADCPGTPFRMQGQVAQKEVPDERAGKSFLTLVQVAPMNPAGQRDAQDLSIPFQRWKWLCLVIQTYHFNRVSTQPYKLSCFCF